MISTATSGFRLKGRLAEGALAMWNPIDAALSRLAYGINAIAPSAKGFLPKPVQRFVHLKVLHANRPYGDLLRRPSRLFLEQEVLPQLSRDYRKVLFVGTASYTYHYEKIFRPGQYTTIDSNPGTAVWGAAEHIVAPIQEIGSHCPKHAFDCVVINGVFGFGIEDTGSMLATVRALHDVLRPDGFLVVGWNNDRHADLATLGVFSPLFAPSDSPPWGRRRTFPPETHVYDFFVRQPDAGG